MAIGLFGLLGKKKSIAPTYEYKPYSGPTPPAIDANGKEYLRPTQDLTQQITMDRAKGIGVGYDPKRTELLTQLVRSNSQADLADNLRTAQGRIAASGLSGNPRAYEAISGRAMRDSNRSLNDNLSKIAIEDLTRQNDEREANTARLFDLNKFNFGQEDTRANFGLDQYNAEEGNRLNAANFNRQTKQYDTNRSDEFVNGLIKAGGYAAGTYFGGPAGGAAGGTLAEQLTSGGNKSGVGIAPESALATPSFYNQPLTYRTRSYRNLASR